LCHDGSLAAVAQGGRGRPRRPDSHSSTHRPDDLKSPTTERARDLRQAAVEKLIKGEAELKTINGARVIEVKSDPADAEGKVRSTKARPSKKSKYVQYDVDREGHIFTILTDFGTKTDPRTGGELPGPRPSCCRVHVIGSGGAHLV
jgi:immune inhibitor A